MLLLGARAGAGTDCDVVCGKDCDDDLVYGVVMMLYHLRVLHALVAVGLLSMRTHTHMRTFVNMCVCVCVYIYIIIDMSVCLSACLTAKLSTIPVCRCLHTPELLG